MINKILFFAYDGKHGTTYHFVDWILAFERNNKNCKMKYLISHKEQNEGLLQKLKNKIDDFDDKFYFIEDFNSDILNNFNIVHVHGLQQLKLVEKHVRHSKIIFTIHSYRNSQWYKNLFKILFSYYLRSVQKIHFVSYYSKDDFFFFNPFRTTLEQKAFVSYLGINKDEFQNTYDFKNEIIDNYGVSFPEDKKNIIYLAQFHYGKGHEWLIKAISKVKNENVIVWLFGDGPTHMEMLNLVRELKLTNKIKLPGLIERKYVPFLLKQSYFSLVTSRNETFGHNYVEPFASGIPVIGTAVGSGDVFLQDYYTGFKVSWKDENKLANFIETALDNKELVSRMGAYAKNLTDIFFTWDAMATNCFSVYSEMNNETNH